VIIAMILLIAVLMVVFVRLIFAIEVQFSLNTIQKFHI
jgi:hypothetical protein